MKKKKLVIFFLALIGVYIIYNITYKETSNYLAIGDDLAKGHTPFDTYNDSYTDYLYTYLKNKDKKMTINKEFISEDLRIKDLLENIKNPSVYEQKNLPQAIQNADIITISIGSEELFAKLRSNNWKTTNEKLYNYVDEMINDLEKLIKEIQKIKKTETYIIGYYNPIVYTSENETKLKSLYNYIDIKLKNLENTKNIYYVEIANEFQNKTYYLPNKEHAFPSLEGYNYIANKIIKKIESH
ncbi:MAG: hypothetical protein HFE04_00520 [Bacilli bacterium]|nr:hypothetical protein [Bacilli bacterium]